MALAFLILSQFKQMYGHAVTRPHEVEELWRQLDRDRRGKVGLGEIEALLKDGDDDRQLQRTAEHMLKCADSDGDGAISRGEYEEVLVKDIEFVVRDNLIGHWRARCD